MNAQQLAFLVSRIFALTYVFYVLSYFIATIAGLGARDISSLMFSAVALLTNISAAAAFWYLAPAISKKLIPDASANDKKAIDMTVLEAQTIGIVVVGLFVLVSAIKPIAYIIVAIVQKYFMEDLPFKYSVSNLWNSAVEMVLYFIVGVFLILSAKGVSSFIQKARGKE